MRIRARPSRADGLFQSARAWLESGVAAGSSASSASASHASHADRSFRFRRWFSHADLRAPLSHPQARRLFPRSAPPLSKRATKGDSRDAPGWARPGARGGECVARRRCDAEDEHSETGRERADDDDSTRLHRMRTRLQLLDASSSGITRLAPLASRKNWSRLSVGGALPSLVAPSTHHTPFSRMAFFTCSKVRNMTTFQLPNRPKLGMNPL